MQFENAVEVEELSNDELHVQGELCQYWQRFGSGTFRATRHCASCQDENIEYQEFTELIVPIDYNHVKVKLETLVFNNSSSRDDNDVWRCERCNVLVRPIKTRRIHDHPEILCILVNRVSFDAQTHRNKRAFSTRILVLGAYTGKGLGLTFFGTITTKLLSREDAVVTMIMFDFGNTVVPEPLFETSLSHDCFVCTKRDLVFNPNQT